jgi:exodeoxyribonuclease VII large subunit
VTELGVRGATREVDVYSVSRLNREAKAILEGALPTLWVEGELSNLSRPSSGHWYFSLKDEHAQVRCAMFRGANFRARVSPRDGMQVLVRGRVSLYEARGDYQLIVEHVEEAGEGLLRRRYEELKARLAVQGLFDSAHKRMPPRVPRAIGVITSPTGAAIHDVLKVLRRRFAAIPVVLYPVPVQGAGAAQDIAAALAVASARAEVDVLILARGGGSLEDLWAFNEEQVARAVRASQIPVISGIGHEVDVTIADFAADVRAPTPSGAAELAVPDAAEWLRALQASELRLGHALARRLRTWREAVGWCMQRLSQLHPGRRLRERAQRLDELESRARRALRSRLEHARARLAERSATLKRLSPEAALAAARARVASAAVHLGHCMRSRIAGYRARQQLALRALHAVSPLATLQRGYAIVTRADGSVVRDARELTAGETLNSRLAHGAFESVVRTVLPER